MSDVERILGLASRTSYRKQAARLAQRMAESADLRGLDLFYAVVDSPFGQLVLAGTPAGLVRLSFDALDHVLTDLARKLSPRILRAPARLDEVRRELDEYFAGWRRQFEVRLDWRLATEFQQHVLTVTANVPFGEVATYAGVATLAGRPRAARATGRALAANPLPILVPCHRVIESRGELGAYAGGIERKDYLLALERARAAG